jgi:hypothetical protein
MLHRGLAVGVAALTLACGRSATYTAPAEPEAAVRAFMHAVQANSMVGMGELWGTRRGPAIRWMNREEMEKRLIVIRTYLDHEQFDLLGPSVPAPGRADADVRLLQVRIVRRGCTPTVPITVVRHGSGWLVNEINLEAAGNPARSCPQ